MWGWHGDVGWGGWLAMSVMMVAFWGLVIFGVLALVRAWGRTEERPRVSRGARHDATEILEDRFARGEIDEEEYRSRLDVLRRERQPSG